MDIFDSESFDIVICCHVLEHVPDDKKAMAEIFRILKDDGIAILLVPIDLNQTYIDEAYDLSLQENIKRFGQEDHVRRYSKAGFIERLNNAGFYMNYYKNNLLRKRKWIKNALTNTSTLYLGTKNQTQNVPKLFWKDKIPCTRIEDLYCDKNLSENKYNYYIDSVKFEEHILTIWGWFYFEGVDSKKSKLKLILRTRQKTKICEFIWRNRPDIDQHFNAKHDGTLLWSGIDIQIDMAKQNFKECDLELRIIHGNSYASIPLGNICRST